MRLCLAGQIVECSSLGGGFAAIPGFGEGLCPPGNRIKRLPSRRELGALGACGTWDVSCGLWVVVFRREDEAVLFAPT